MLYEELHLTCERAATALLLAGLVDAPITELLRTFEKEEARADLIWTEIQSRGYLPSSPS
jgi:hypothetical protein